MARAVARRTHRGAICLGSLLAIAATTTCSSDSTSSDQSTTDVPATTAGTGTTVTVPESSTGTSTPVPTTSAPTAGNAGASTTTAAPASPDLVRCTTAQLRETTRDTGVAAGSSYTGVVFTNTGPTPCALSGQPGVTFLDVQGGPVGRTIPPVPEGPVITVAPGGTANTTLVVSNANNYPPERCPATHLALSVRLTLPAGGGDATVRSENQVCDGTEQSVSTTAMAAGDNPSGP